MPVVSAALPFPPHQPQFYPAPPIQNPRLLPNHISPYPNQFYYNQQPMHMHPNMMQMTPGMPYLQPQCIPPNQMAPPPHLPEVSGIHQSHSAPQLSAGSYPDNSPSRLVQSYTIGMKAMEAMEKQHYERHNKGYVRDLSKPTQMLNFWSSGRIRQSVQIVVPRQLPIRASLFGSILGYPV